MITIFTPTYNREKTLHRLYESLLNQTIFDFEWIIIDDQSTDKTEQTVQDWKKKTYQFNITYLKVNHGGKHRAINKAVSLASYDWFFIVDSDDYISSDAIEKIILWIKEIEYDYKIAAVVGSRYEIKRKEALSVPSILRLNPGMICKNQDRSLYGLDCDKAEVYRTAILKKFPFPEYENEYFVTEATVWDSISYAGYYLKFYPDAIYYCEYRDDGLTKNGANEYGNFLNNMRGFFDYVRIEVKCHGINNTTEPLIFMALSIAIKHAVSLSAVSEYLDISLQTLSDEQKKAKKNRNLFIRGLRYLLRKLS